MFRQPGQDRPHRPRRARPGAIRAQDDHVKVVGKTSVLVVTFDEWGGFYDHVPPPRVVDDTNPADVNHSGDGTTPTDGQLVPDYTQLGFRVPTIVVSNLAER